MTKNPFGKIHTAALFSTLLIALTPLGAQEPDPVEPTSPPFDIDFQEATVAEACEFIQRKLSELDKKTPFNIVDSKEAENITLPSMQLQNPDGTSRFIVFDPPAPADSL